jgi:glycosyltransferase involved in cell wall biosynthesis
VSTVNALPRALVWAVKVIAAAISLPAVLVWVLFCRLESRRAPGRRPRLIWGPTPLISIKYWSQALQALGYVSTTCVYELYDINTREDFDRHRDEFLPRGLQYEPFRDFAAFCWALRNADVFCFFFDGGFLRHTALRNVECLLLRLAGKRVVLSPYGSDIAIPGYLGPFEEAMIADYPMVVHDAGRVRRRVDYFCRWGDLVIRNLQVGYLPRHDATWPSQLAVDTELFRPDARGRWNDGSPDPPRELSIVHAPNHRRLKGTEHVIAAVEELRAEGVAIRLDLLERRPNTEVREALRRADLVVEQLIGGYAMFAIEAMASGAPVLSRLGWLPAEMRVHSTLADCPIVDVGPDTLKDALRALARDAPRRKELSLASREYAVAHHSFAAVGRLWAELIEHVWRGTPLPQILT